MGRPDMARRRFSATTGAAVSGRVSAAIWGVTVTPGWDQNGWPPGSGSVRKTSSTACPRSPRSSPAGIDDPGPARQHGQVIIIQQIPRPRGVGQQVDQDFGPAQGRSQMVRVKDLDAFDRAARGAEARQPKADRAQHRGGGTAQLSEAQDGHAPLGRQRCDDIVAPGAVLCIAVHPQMRPHRPAGAEFRHAPRQARIDHPRQRLGQGRVGDDPLDPGPQALDQPCISIGRQILDLAARRVDDGVEAGRFAAPVQIHFGTGFAQGRGPGLPRLGTGGKENAHLATSIGEHGRIAPGRSPASGSSARCHHS